MEAQGIGLSLCPQITWQIPPGEGGPVLQALQTVTPWSSFPRSGRQGRPTCHPSMARWTWIEVPSCRCPWASGPCSANTESRYVRAPPAPPRPRGPALDGPCPLPPTLSPNPGSEHIPHCWHQTPGSFNNLRLLSIFQTRKLRGQGVGSDSSKVTPGGSRRHRPLPTSVCAESPAACWDLSQPSHLQPHAHPHPTAP